MKTIKQIKQVLTPDVIEHLDLLDEALGNEEAIKIISKLLNIKDNTEVKICIDYLKTKNINFI